MSGRSGEVGQPLDRAQTDALGPPVGGHLVCRRPERPPGQQAHERVGAAAAGRGSFGGRVASASAPAQSANVSFTIRSSSEWYASTSTRPPGPITCTDSSSPSARFGQLAIHFHADRLEGAARGVRTTRRGRGAGSTRESTSTSSRVVRNGRAATMRVRDAPGESLLAVAGEITLGQLAHVVAVHDVGRGQRLLGVHAHVEGRVEPVREATLGPVELRAAHSEIHQDAHDLLSLAVADRPTRRAARIRLAPPAPASRRERAGNGRHPRRRRHGRFRADARRAARRDSAAEWPAPPTVQSTISPAGTGRRSSTTSRTITGRCENSASTSVSSNRFAGTASPPAPSPAPRSTGAARDVSPSRQRLIAGGVGANNRAGRGAGDGPGIRAPSSCQRSLLSDFDLCIRSEEVVDAFAADDGGDALRVALGEHLRVPDLEVVEVAGDDHLTLEPGVLAQVRRDRDPALLVGRDLDRAGEERAGGLALRAPRSRASRSLTATRSNSSTGYTARQPSSALAITAPPSSWSRNRPGG